MEATARKLTENQKRKTWREVWDNKQPDDEHPRKVINEKHGGSENAYLKVMAQYYKIN